MSKTLEPASLLIQITLEELLKAVVKKSNGTVNAINTRPDGEEITTVTEFCNGMYNLFLDFVWNGTNYEVTRFYSVEAVEKLTEGFYMQAERTLTYEVGDGKWVLRSPKNLISLFEAHNKWSAFWNLQPVFQLS